MNKLLTCCSGSKIPERSRIRPSAWQDPMIPAFDAHGCRLGWSAFVLCRSLPSSFEAAIRITIIGKSPFANAPCQVINL